LRGHIDEKALDIIFDKFENHMELESTELKQYIDAGRSRGLEIQKGIYKDDDDDENIIDSILANVEKDNNNINKLLNKGKK
jgi:hypothetical protein